MPPVWGTRVCAGCEHHLPKSAYSSNQWSKGAVGPSGGSERSRCTSCVASREHADPTAARRNGTTEFHFDLTARWFARGKFKLCYLGLYLNGPRTQDECVKKVFRKGCTYAADAWAAELSIVERTVEICTQFNEMVRPPHRVRVNVPALASRRTRRGHNELFLVEPLVRDFQHWNSNTGWVTPHPTVASEVCKALSHFSYHLSSGQLTLCDLQGGFSNSGGFIVLSDPVLHSTTEQRYGPTDLGRDGSVNFMTKHRCGAYCDSEWTRPPEREDIFRAVRDTRMSIAAATGNRPRRYSVIQEETSEDEDY